MRWKNPKTKKTAKKTHKKIIAITAQNAPTSVPAIREVRFPRAIVLVTFKGKVEEPASQ